MTIALSSPQVAASIPEWIEFAVHSNAERRHHVDENKSYAKKRPRSMDTLTTLLSPPSLLSLEDSLRSSSSEHSLTSRTVDLDQEFSDVSSISVWDEDDDLEETTNRPTILSFDNHHESNVDTFNGMTLFLKFFVAGAVLQQLYTTGDISSLWTTIAADVIDINDENVTKGIQSFLSVVALYGLFFVSAGYQPTKQL